MGWRAVVVVLQQASTAEAQDHQQTERVYSVLCCLICGHGVLQGVHHRQLVPSRAPASRVAVLLLCCCHAVRHPHHLLQRPASAGPAPSAAPAAKGSAAQAAKHGCTSTDAVAKLPLHQPGTLAPAWHQAPETTSLSRKAQSFQCCSRQAGKQSRWVPLKNVVPVRFVLSVNGFQTFDSFIDHGRPARSKDVSVTPRALDASAELVCNLHASHC